MRSSFGGGGGHYSPHQARVGHSKPSGGDADIRQRVERREAGHEVVQPRERDQVHGDLVQVHVEGSLETG